MTHRMILYKIIRTWCTQKTFSCLFIMCMLFYKMTAAQSTLTLTVDTSATAIQIPSNFVGFSYDPSFMSQFFSPNYNGNNSQQITRQLLQNFLPNQLPDIRILGNNRVFWRNGPFIAPTSWNMTNGYNCVSCPVGVPNITTTYSTTQLNTYATFLSTLNYKPTTLFGISLAFLDSARARDFANEVKSRFSAYPYLFEIGNEPDIYIKLGRRNPTYSFSEYMNEFNLIKTAVMPFGDVAGPTLAIINNSNPDAWSSETGRFIKGAGSPLKLITMHQYSLGEKEDANLDWIRKYLSEVYTFKKVNDTESGIKLCIDTCKQYNVPFRLAEANTITLGGLEGVSDAFGSALWIMDYMFELAKAGSSGIHVMISGGSNFHYSPYTLTPEFLTLNDKVRVNPIYYGMLFFSQAAVQGSRLLSVSPQNNTSPNVNSWVTKDATGTIRVLIINRGSATTDQSVSNITVRVPGAVTTARKYDLSADGGSITGALGKTVASGANFTIGGQTISSQTGAREGNVSFTDILPSNNRYTISCKAGSASILEIPASVITSTYENPEISDKHIHIYPNPAVGWTTLEITGNEKIKEFYVTDLQGKIIYQYKGAPFAKKIIPMSGFSNQVNIVHVIAKDKLIRKKIFINR